MYLQLKGSMGLLVKRRELLPRFGFPSRRSITEVVEGAVKNQFVPPIMPKAPPLNACSLSSLPRSEARPGHVRKLPVTWG